MQSGERGRLSESQFMSALDTGIAIPTIRRAIDTAVRDFWVNDLGQSEDRISWPNVQFQTPLPKPGLTVAHNFGAAIPKTWISNGYGLSLQTGILMLTVYGPKMEGTAQLDELAS